MAALAERFTLVNVGDDFAAGSATQNFEPSGGYIPRVLFFSPAPERALLEIKGPNAQYPHFYSSAEQIIASMERVLAETPSGGGGDSDDGDDGHDEI